MAVSKVIASTTLAIEVENGQDSTGATIYKKKSFNGVKSDAANENILAVSDAIKTVLAAPSRDVFLTDCAKLTIEE